MSGKQTKCGVCGEPIQGVRLLCFAASGEALGWIHSSPVCAAVSADFAYPLEPYTHQQMQKFADALGYALPNTKEGE